MRKRWFYFAFILRGVQSLPMPPVSKKVLPFYGPAALMEFRRSSRREEGPFFSLLASVSSDGKYRFMVVASKRSIGGAVERNRAKRRLRAAYRELFESFEPIEVVLYAKKGALTADFAAIVQNLKEGLAHALPAGSSH